MESWNKAKIIISFLATIAIPVVIGIVGNQYTKAIKEREIQGRFVELGVDILSQPPTENTKNLRKWATKIIDQYSGVPFDEATRNDLIDSLQITAEQTLDYNLSQVQKMDVAAGAMVKSLLLELEKRQTFILLKNPDRNGKVIEYEFVKGDQTLVSRLALALGFKNVTDSLLEIQ